MAKKQTEAPFSKRGNPFKRGETWTFIYYVKDSTGKRVQKWKGGYTTKKEAEADQRIYRAKAELGMIRLTADITLETYLNTWFEMHKKTLQPSTVNSYYNTIYNDAIPALGNVKLYSNKNSEYSFIQENSLFKILRIVNISIFLVFFSFYDIFLSKNS